MREREIWVFHLLILSGQSKLYSAVNTEEAHHSTTNNEELYYSTVNCEELYYSNAKMIEMRRNEMPPQHSFQINMEENPAYVVGRPGTVTVRWLLVIYPLSATFTKYILFIKRMSVYMVCRHILVHVHNLKLTTERVCVCMVLMKRKYMAVVKRRCSAVEGS